MHNMCLNCALCLNRQECIHGVGSGESGICIIGEAPGKKEIENKLPFSGAAGKALRLLLTEAGISESKSRITNCIRCRPPKNRKPTALELERCSTFLSEELQLFRPKVIITVGLTASQFLLKSKKSIKDLIKNCPETGYIAKIASVNTYIFPIYHTSPLCLNRESSRKSQNLTILKHASKVAYDCLNQ